jgi:hypothetical protein
MWSRISGGIRRSGGSAVAIDFSSIDDGAPFPSFAELMLVDASRTSSLPHMSFCFWREGPGSASVSGRFIVASITVGAVSEEGNARGGKEKSMAEFIVLSGVITSLINTYPLRPKL